MGTILQGVDALDIIRFVENKNKRIQATFLGEVEKIIPRDSEEFGKIRKLYLDYSNGYERAVLTAIFGDVEGR